MAFLRFFVLVLFAFLILWFFLANPWVILVIAVAAVIAVPLFFLYHIGRLSMRLFIAYPIVVIIILLVLIALIRAQ